MPRPRVPYRQRQLEHVPGQYTPVDGGTQTLSTDYSGDATHDPSSGTGALSVRRTTGTSVVCTPDTTDLGVSTTCTATVTDTSPVGTVGTPSGTVTWSVTPAGRGALAHPAAAR